VDVNGALMGINTAIYPLRWLHGHRFYHSVSTARQVLEGIVKRRPSHAWIGVEPQEINAELLETLALSRTCCCNPA
jgi:S1-C subfamily serine protease